MGDVAPGKRLRASARSWIAAHRFAGGDCSRGRLALVKPGLPATAFGGKGLTRASAPAPAPPCVRRQSGAGSPISTHSDFKRGLMGQLSLVTEFNQDKFNNLGLIDHLPVPFSRLLVSLQVTVPFWENSYSQTQPFTHPVHLPIKSSRSSD